MDERLDENVGEQQVRVLGKMVGERLEMLGERSEEWWGERLVE